MKAIVLFLAILGSISIYSQTNNEPFNNINNNTLTTKNNNGIDTLFIGVEHRDPRYMYGLNWFDEYVLILRIQALEELEVHLLIIL